MSPSARAARLGRRLAALALLVPAALLAGAMLRGIIGTLLAGSPPRGVTAAADLGRCVRDLEALERDFRAELAAQVGAAHPSLPAWPDLVRPFEARRARIEAACDLDRDAPEPPPAAALAEAAAELEEAFGAAGLVWERFRGDGARRLAEARAALETARRHLEPPRENGPPPED
jgi:hypothetical protein